MIGLGLSLLLQSSSRKCASIGGLSARAFSDSVTYSGGQASAGQGGFYGSGRSRAAKPQRPAHHPEAVARREDIDDLSLIVNSVLKMEAVLEALGNIVNARTVELKKRIKKSMRNPNVSDMLDRLIIKGQPVWGLSTKERDLVRLAKRKHEAL